MSGEHMYEKLKRLEGKTVSFVVSNELRDEEKTLQDISITCSDGTIITILDGVEES